MHIVFILVAAVLGVLLPDLAWADGVLTPAHGNTWDLYVFGNGHVVYDILTSIKMLMVPDAGSTGFKTLLLLLASLGFLTLAVAAGFDPGKNLMRMFSYILVVWGVSWGSTSLTANLNINDLVVSGGSVSSTYTVDRVPALVALPAALTSQVGYYFTRVIETYFSTPDGFKVTTGGAGQFNLFGKMMQESNEFAFTDAGLKQSMQAYVTDCVVASIAMGTFQGQVKDPLTGAVSTGTGITVLAESVDLMTSFASAKNDALMTKTYPSSLNPPSTATAATADGQTPAAMGTVVTCSDAYKNMFDMAQANANALLKASSDAYAKAGIMTPYETLFSSMLAGASAPGGAGSTYSRPSGYILQQGMLNSMSGAFRQAALQTGNNELMTAASLAQAEQNQRSSMVSAFEVFNNMAGYTFTVLQAFMFAITPIVVVALMVPGLGKSIFTNYAQILIWLTLWEPMLSIVNYIITLFGTDGIQSAMAMSGGLSASNKGLISERTINLQIAAQFLGTMVPLLTWGLVKGALAFTEFISHGIGSQFAAQAGATAASGNLSLNNMSMDNTSMNKYNTAMSSTVGTQATNAFTNAGSLMVSQDGGGGGVQRAGSAVQSSRNASESFSKSIAESKAISSAINEAFSHSKSVEDAISYAKSHGDQAVAEQAAARIRSSQKAVSIANGAATNKNAETRQQIQDAANANTGIKTDTSLGANAKATAGVDVLGNAVTAGVTADYKVNTHSGTDNSHAAADVKGAGEVHGLKQNDTNVSKNGSDGTQVTDGNRKAHTDDAQRGARHGEGSSFQQVKQDALSKQNSVTESLQAAKSVVDSFQASNDLDTQMVNQRVAEIDAMHGHLAGDASAIGTKAAALADAVSGRDHEIMGAYNGTKAKAEHQMAAMGPSSGAPAHYDDYRAASNATVNEVTNKLAAQTSAFEAEHDAIKKATGKEQARMDQGGSSNLALNHITRTGKTDIPDPKSLLETVTAKPHHK